MLGPQVWTWPKGKGSKWPTPKSPLPPGWFTFLANKPLLVAAGFVVPLSVEGRVVCHLDAFFRRASRGFAHHPVRVEQGLAIWPDQRTLQTNIRSGGWRNGLVIQDYCPTRSTPQKYAFLPCGHLDFESPVTAENGESKCSFHSSYWPLLNIKT